MNGKLYVGRTSAGGVATEIDIDGDGKSDVKFSTQCGFLLQLDNGKVIALETDRSVSAEIRGSRVTVKAHSPVVLPAANRSR